MDIALKPTLLTDFRLAYYRYNIKTHKPDQDVAFADQLGIPGSEHAAISTPAARRPSTSRPCPAEAAETRGTGYGDGLNVNRCNCPLTEKEDQYQIVNNWTKVWGNHPSRWVRTCVMPATCACLQTTTAPASSNSAPDETSNPAAVPPRAALGLPAGCWARSHNFQALRFDIDQRQRIPETDVLLRAGYVARHPQPDVEHRPALGTVLPGEGECRRKRRSAEPE